MSLNAEQRRALRRACDPIVPGFAIASPADELRRLAAWYDEHSIEDDAYGEGPLVQDFERKVATLLGKDAAVFVPSGIMAQLIALRIHMEAARLDRFGMHPTSHLAHHEHEAHVAVMRAHAVPLGDRLRPMVAADLDASRQPMACAIVELPIREAGGQLPSWDELEALKATARDRGIALHMDGARLWESAARFDRSYAEIADGFASVYVSLYKGIGGPAGALLAGSDDFIAQARLWRKRMGGTLYHLSPLVAPAAMRFDERIALMPALYRRAVDFAASLPLVRLRVDPEVPHTNLLHLYLDATADAAMDARDAVAADRRCWLFDRARPAEVPGWSVTELYVGDRLLALPDDRTSALFAALCERLPAK